MNIIILTYPLARRFTDDELKKISTEINVVKDGSVEVSWVIEEGSNPLETRRIADKLKEAMIEAGYEDKTKNK